MPKCLFGHVFFQYCLIQLEVKEEEKEQTSGRGERTNKWVHKGALRFWSYL